MGIFLRLVEMMLYSIGNHLLLYTQFPEMESRFFLIFPSARENFSPIAAARVAPSSARVMDAYLAPAANAGPLPPKTVV